MWFIGVEVEQETSAPPPKRNPESAPVEPHLTCKTCNLKDLSDVFLIRILLCVYLCRPEPVCGGVRLRLLRLFGKNSLSLL